MLQFLTYARDQPGLFPQPTRKLLGLSPLFKAQDMTNHKQNSTHRQQGRTIYNTTFSIRQ
jgi:hypothetical protein